jgi:hypothetical protein
MPNYDVSNLFNIKELCLAKKAPILRFSRKGREKHRNLQGGRELALDRYLA